MSLMAQMSLHNDLGFGKCASIIQIIDRQPILATVIFSIKVPRHVACTFFSKRLTHEDEPSNTACLALGPSNDLRFIKYELVAGVQAMQDCAVGHVAIANRRCMLCYAGFEGFASFSNIFGSTSFAS